MQPAKEANPNLQLATEILPRTTAAAAQQDTETEIADKQAKESEITNLKLKLARTSNRELATVQQTLDEQFIGLHFSGSLEASLNRLALIQKANEAASAEVSRRKSCCVVM